MPRQVIAVGRASFSGTNIFWRWNEPLTHQLNSRLVTGGGEAWLGDLYLRGGNAQSRLVFYVGQSMTTFRDLVDMSDDAENFESTFVIRAGGEALYVPGPNYIGNSFRNATGTYQWLPSSSVRGDITRFITHYRTLSLTDRNATTLEIRDSYIRLTKGSATYNKVYAGNTERKKIYYGNRLVHDVVG